MPTGGAAQTLSDRFAFVEQQRQQLEERQMASRSRRQVAVMQARQLRAYDPTYDDVLVTVSSRRGRGKSNTTSAHYSQQRGPSDPAVSYSYLPEDELPLPQGGSGGMRPSQYHGSAAVTTQTVPVAVPMFLAPQQMPFVVQQSGPQVQYTQQPYGQPRGGRGGRGGGRQKPMSADTLDSDLDKYMNRNSAVSRQEQLDNDLEKYKNSGEL
ncbi:hypothetical protein Pelo_13472 [Pelomyxa schiedti]|nr:hypothetical protein Pelo_13472 [Pelomyxa schiedti]